MIKKGTRVSLGRLTGTVTRKSTIVIAGKNTVVYDVKWDGNPNGIPMKFKDEAGSNKKGYLADSLTLI